ncbi:M20 family metallo-hydrolase [Pseudonocardia sichuanensis]
MAGPDALNPVAERLKDDLTELATIRAPESGGWTRTVFSEPYRSARDWVRARMRSAGLDVHADGAGNLIGVLPGRDPSAPALMTGSHTDTVESGGRFDGVVGVLGALEAVRLMRENGIRLERDLLVVDFLGEESNDFGLSCLGSRALAGELTRAHLDRVDHEGVRLGDRYTGFGLDPSAVLAAAGDFATNGLHRYLELHIEQGPVLEEHGSAIGVVTAIAGIRRLVADFIGRADHAGTTPMTVRRDALAAAAAAVLAVRQEGCGAPVHGVATTSRLDAEPGSPNVVPARVRMQAEMRSVDVGWLSDAQRRLAQKITEQAGEFGVDADLRWSVDNDSVPAHADVQQTVTSITDALGIGWEAIPSGATHDAVHIARLCPMGMIFIPSREGRSHCPEEWTELDDILTGVRVHTETLIALDRSA